MLTLITTGIAQFMPNNWLLIDHMIRQIEHDLISQPLTILLKQKLRVAMADLTTIIHEIVVEPYYRSFDIHMYGVGHAVQLQVFMGGVVGLEAVQRTEPGDCSNLELVHHVVIIIMRLRADIADVIFDIPLLTVQAGLVADVYQLPAVRTLQFQILQILLRLRIRQLRIFLYVGRRGQHPTAWESTVIAEHKGMIMRKSFLLVAQFADIEVQAFFAGSISVGIALFVAVTAERRRVLLVAE